VTVTDPNVSANNGTAITVAENASTNTVVWPRSAIQLRPAASEDASDYNATIAWATARPRRGDCLQQHDHLFEVSGSHTYSGDNIGGESEGSATITPRFSTNHCRR